MALPILFVVQIVLDLAIILALVVTIITISGIIKDFLVENLVDILIDMPDFEYSLDHTGENGNMLFQVFRQQREAVLYGMIGLGAIAWLITGRFGHRTSHVMEGEQVREVTDGVHPMMRPKRTMIRRMDSYGTMGFGADPRGSHWAYVWMSSLPSRCVLCIVILFILPPLWDYSIDGSEWVSTKILNNVYSGNGEYPCPPQWYTNGVLDTDNEALQKHYHVTRYLLMQDKTGKLDAMCQPELRVRYMLEQWGGNTKAIPPPVDVSGSFWETITSHWDNAADWMYRGFGEFIVNILFGMIKAQAVIMTGTGMIISNVAVDVATATMLVFVPVYLLLMLFPWENIPGGGRIKQVLTTYGPASLAAAILYPIEVAILFSISSELMVGLLLSDYGNDVLVVWMFGTGIMSMAMAMPIVSLGAFATIIQQVTGSFTTMIQAAQGVVGAGAGRLGMGVGAGPTGAAGTAVGKAGGKAGGKAT